jgi:hypothetical protein
MKRFILSATVLMFCSTLLLGQKTPVAKVSTVISAEENFNKLIAKKGIKDGFFGRCRS